VDVKDRRAHNLLWACGATWGLRPKVVHGYTFLSFNSPLLLHHWYGGLAVKTAGV